MKIKTKLLSIIAPAALLTTVAPIALTSCGGDGQSSNHVTYQGEKTYSSTSSIWTLQFTLSSVLETNQTLKVSFTKCSHVVIDNPIINGTNVVVKITHTGDTSTMGTFDLIFKCFTSPSTVVTTWEQEFKGFTFTKTA